MNYLASHHHVDQTASVGSTTAKQCALVSPGIPDLHRSADQNVLSALNVLRKRHASTTDVLIHVQIRVAWEPNVIPKTTTQFALAHLGIREIHSNNALRFVSTILYISNNMYSN